MTKIRCTLCNDIIESKYRHDFVECKCGKTFADGGKDYIRTTVHGEVISDEIRNDEKRV